MSKGAEQRGQMAFLIGDFHELGATHTIFPGAYILVYAPTSSHYAACHLKTSLDVCMLPFREERQHRDRMGQCTALQSFTVHYSANEQGRPEKDVEYPSGTQLFAFRKPEDGTVIPIQKRSR